jgi:endoglucanase
MKNTIYTLIFLLLQGVGAFASEIVSVRPINSRILMVHFDDGFIQYHGFGQTSDDDIVVRDTLNWAAARLLTNYAITSTNDPNYGGRRNPVDLGRKTKGTEFSGLCQGWGFIPYFNDIGCINTDPDHVKEHWIYLYLPNALVSGASYTLTVNGLASNSNTHTFTFDEKNLRSDAVHVNIIGYSTHAPQKYGYVYAWLGDKGGMDFTGYEGSAFHLIDTKTQIIAYTGRIAFRKPFDSQETGQVGETPNQNFLGAKVYECDFTNFNTPGEYRLVVDGFGCSYPFSIHTDVLREPFHAVMRGIYQNRSGIDLTMPYAQNRPAPHNVLATPGFAGKLKYTKTTWCEVRASDASMDDKPLWEAGIVGNLTDTWGWYQDAGDWDGYIIHMKLPTYLMFLYEQFPNHFTDGEIVLPESGNGQPDVLDEARWLLRFYKRLKDELLEKNWGTGGIGGSRIFGDLWGEDDAPDGTGRGSWADTTRTWVVSGEDAFITYWYAGAAAHYHYLLTSHNWTDVEGINWLSEAEAAYSWAQNHSSSSNSCHDFEMVYLRAYASASLYKATGNVAYHSHFLRDAPKLNLSSANAELTEYKAFGAWQYCSLPKGLQTDLTVYNGSKNAIITTADFQLLFPGLDGRACRWGGNLWFPMLVGHGTTPFVTEGVMAMALFRNSNPAKTLQYKTVLHNTADYFLGTNPLNMTWITGLGEDYPKHIFHKDSWYAPGGGIRQGINIYGPWRREYFGPYGWWRADWPAFTAYPALEKFPGHERWFSIRTAPFSSEFTIHQNNLTSAFVFGALLDSLTTVSVDNETPHSRESDDLVLFPNPTNGRLHLTLNHALPVSYSILNTTGGEIMSGRYAGVPIKTESLPSGFYVVVVFDNQGNRWSAKLLKQ